MSWTISINGPRALAVQAAAAQADVNIANGYQTVNQKAMCVAAIECAHGSHVSGTISGHNGGEVETAHGTLHMNLTSWSE